MSIMDTIKGMFGGGKCECEKGDDCCKTEETITATPTPPTVETPAAPVAEEPKAEGQTSETPQQ